MDGEHFDPHAHFSKWKSIDDRARNDFRNRAPIDLANALLEAPHATNQQLADTLNKNGSRSSTGKLWTKETVRKTRTKLGGPQ